MQHSQRSPQRRTGTPHLPNRRAIFGSTGGLHTNNSGDVTISHGLGTTPYGILVGLDTFVDAQISVYEYTSTTFKCRVYSGGAVKKDDDIGHVYWVAFV